MPHLHLVVVAALSVCLQPSWANFDGATGLRFELPDNEEFCFYQPYQESRRHVLEYNVLSGGNLDVDATLSSPNGLVLYSKQRESKDKHVFESSFGTFKVCFSNAFSSVTHKVIYFELRPEQQRPLGGEIGVTKPTVHTQLEQYQEALYQYLQMVVALQTEYRLREAKGRYEAEELHNKVQYQSLFFTFSIMLTGLGQVYVLRTFFSEHKPATKQHRFTVPETPTLIGL